MALHVGLMFMGLLLLSAVPAIALAGLASLPPTPPAPPRVLYTVRHAGDRLDVEVAIRHPPAAGWRYRLDGFGEWAEANVPYLELVEARPEVEVDADEPGSFACAAPDAAPPDAHLRYSIHLLRVGSEAQQRHGLLAAAAEGYVFAYTSNTLVEVFEGWPAGPGDAGGAPLAGRREVHFIGEDGETIVSGMAGESQGEQRAVLGATVANGPFACGEPARRRTTARDGFRAEVWQFGAGPDVTATVLAVIDACAPAFGAAFGAPARNPYRAFVTDHQGGGMGSRFGLRIGVTAEAPADLAGSPWLAHHVAHELLHDWIGIALEAEDDSLIWFTEGFTEYLSLWQTAAAGLVDRHYFRGRLLELEAIARERSSAGRMVFADPSVRWRDGDGPNETLAYSGAPLLALRIDAELRSSGHPGLPQLVRDLLPGGKVAVADIKTWLEAAGCGDRVRRSIAGTELPDVAESLRLAGFAEREERVDLCYLGLRTDADSPEASVLAVDPDGPAAAAGIAAGDVLTGWFPVRAAAAERGAGELDEDIERFPFGVFSFDPDREGAFVNYRRGGADHHAPITLRRLPGAGLLRRVVADTKECDRFFRFAPRRP